MKARYSLTLLGLGVPNEPFSVQMMMSGAAALDCTPDPIVKDIPNEDKQSVSERVVGKLFFWGEYYLEFFTCLTSYTYNFY